MEKFEKLFPTESVVIEGFGEVLVRELSMVEALEFGDIDVESESQEALIDHNVKLINLCVEKRPFEEVETKKLPMKVFTRLQKEAQRVGLGVKPDKEGDSNPN